jgi:hypothetical protein
VAIAGLPVTVASGLKNVSVQRNMVQWGPCSISFVIGMLIFLYFHARAVGQFCLRVVYLFSYGLNNFGSVWGMLQLSAFACTCAWGAFVCHFPCFLHLEGLLGACLSVSSVFTSRGVVSCCAVLSSLSTAFCDGKKKKVSYDQKKRGTLAVQHDHPTIENSFQQNITL